MVAYNFPDWMEPGIVSGAKTHTVRALKKPPARHARPGEVARLYVGLRTKAARVIAEPVCTGLRPVRFTFPERLGATAFTIEGERVEPEAFAIADGFRDLAHMRAFWFEVHAPRGATALDFTGALIDWTERAA